VEKFIHFVVQGGVEAIKVKEKGRTSHCKKTTNLACTFNEITCKSLIGTQLPGQVRKKLNHTNTLIVKQA
jgi:hypothetical protein